MQPFPTSVNLEELVTNLLTIGRATAKEWFDDLLTEVCEEVGLDTGYHRHDTLVAAAMLSTELVDGPSPLHDAVRDDLPDETHRGIYTAIQGGEFGVWELLPAKGLRRSVARHPGLGQRRGRRVSKVDRVLGLDEVPKRYRATIIGVLFERGKRRMFLGLARLGARAEEAALAWLETLEEVDAPTLTRRAISAHICPTKPQPVYVPPPVEDWLLDYAGWLGVCVRRRLRGRISLGLPAPRQRMMLRSWATVLRPEQRARARAELESLCERICVDALQWSRYDGSKQRFAELAGLDAFLTAEGLTSDLQPAGYDPSALERHPAAMLLLPEGHPAWVDVEPQQPIRALVTWDPEHRDSALQEALRIYRAERRWWCAGGGRRPGHWDLEEALELVFHPGLAAAPLDTLRVTAKLRLRVQQMLETVTDGVGEFTVADLGTDFSAIRSHRLNTRRTSNTLHEALVDALENWRARTAGVDPAMLERLDAGGVPEVLSGGLDELAALFGGEEEA